MKKCPKGHDVDGNLRFCPKCGAELIESETRFCKKCGNERKGNENFCSKCGTPFGEVRSLTSNKSVVEPPKVEENVLDSEYESKPWRDNLPLIIGALVVICMIGAGWWYWDSSNKRVAREKAIADSLEIVRQDSIKDAKLREEKEREDNERRLKLEACRNYVEKFYNEYERIENQDEYLRKNCTNNALNTLKEEYFYDCDNDDCLATWLFFYEAGTDAEYVKREFIPEDEYTCRVNNITNDGDVYSVTIGIVEDNGRFKINKIVTSSN